MLIIKGVTSAQQERLGNVLLYPDTTFDNYPDRMCWAESEFGRNVLHDIDRLDTLDPSVSVDLILRNQDMRLSDISTGSKNLMLCKFYQSRHCSKIYFRLGRMGENCFKWLLQIAREKDVCVVTTVFRRFNEEDINGSIVYFEDLQRTVYTALEVNRCIAKLGDLGLLQA